MGRLLHLVPSLGQGRGAVTLAWLCLTTSSLFLHSRKTMPAPGPLHLLLPLSEILLLWPFPQ